MVDLERVLAELDDGFFFLDGELRVRLFNPAAERILGRRASDVLGRSLFDEAFPEAKGSEFEVQYRKALATGCPQRFEVRFDAAPYDAWYDVRALPAAGGLAVFFRASDRESLQMREVRASEEKLRTLCETLQEGLWLIDEKERTSYVNPAMAAMLGHDVEEMLGRSIADFVPDTGQALIADQIARRRSGIAEVHDFVLARRDGHPVEVRVATSPLVDDEGHFRGAVAALTDVGLERRREKADALVAQVAEAMLRPEKDQETLCRILLDACRTLTTSRLGFIASVAETDGSLVSHTLDEGLREGRCAVGTATPGHVRFVPDAQGRYPGLWGVALDGGRAFFTNDAARHPAAVGIPDGHHPIAACLLVPVLVGNERLGLIALAEPERPYDEVDVALIERMGHLLGLLVRREREEEKERLFREKMEQTQKLESLGVLAGGIAHDFNNLLMGVLGNADLALDELSPQSPARDSLEDIVTSAKRAADLCRQLLAYSGKGRFLVEPLNVNALVEEMVSLLQISISKTAVLKLELADSLPLIEADATQMRQILMNLVTNASEAIGTRSGIISVTTGALDCDEAYLADSFLEDELEGGTYVFFEVSDTGSGMDAETRDRIFDPFFSTKFTGRGLGLSAVLGIVRGHHGAIRVYSEPGRGTTFKVLFPASEKDVPEAREGAEPEIVPGVKRLALLVDDEETVRAVAKRMLERLGFEVLLARDGVEGVALFEKRHDELACVLLDLTMPHMDGEEAFRRMRRIDDTVPVILSSGYNEQDVVHRFAGKGLTGFIQKPYRKERLVEALAALSTS